MDCLKSLSKCFNSYVFPKTESLDNQPHIEIYWFEEENIEFFVEHYFFSHKVNVLREKHLKSLDDLLKVENKDKITKLSLKNMGIDDISFLKDFPNITSLDLAFNKLTHLIQFTEFESLHNLVKLNLSYNTFYTLKGLSKCINLEELYLTYNTLNNSDLEELKSLTSLRVLDIDETQITSIEMLDELKYLEYVYMPFFCKFGNVGRKLKNDLLDSNRLFYGRGILSSNIYFKKFYMLSDGTNWGRKKFVI
jgi:hypothetical protein